MRRKIVQSLVIVVTFFLGIFFCYIFITYYPLKIEKVERVVTKYEVEEDATHDAIEKIYDAVVVVETFKNNAHSSSGTGFVYKKDNSKGYIITNNHVISGSDKVEVILTNGERVPATVLGSDVVGDIAVLSIPHTKVIRIAEIGDSNDVKLGSTVLAIGAPMGSEYSGTTTKGCVSGVDRLVGFGLGDGQSNDILMRVIQTDAAINPGNSGGPLINLAGAVVGITSLKLVRAEIEGIGFAIPIEDAMRYMDELEEGETIKRPVLGLQLLNVDEIYALFYNNIIIDKDIEAGAVVQYVIDKTTASAAGLKKGDIILQLGNVKIKNKAELRYELYKHAVGDKLKLIYYRKGKTNQIEIVLKGND